MPAAGDWGRVEGIPKGGQGRPTLLPLAKKGSRRRGDRRSNGEPERSGQGEGLACLQRKRRREWAGVSLTDWPLQTCPWSASWAYAHPFSEDAGIAILELQSVLRQNSHQRPEET